MIIFENLERLLYIADIYRRDGNYGKTCELLIKVARELAKPIDFSQASGIIEDEKRYNHNHDPKTGKFTSAPGVDNSAGSGIIKEIDMKDTSEVKIIGKLDKDIYSCVTSDITTDEVIITEERINHIKERHPNDYERYFEYAAKAIQKPNYILESNKPNTAFVLKHITENNKNFQLILRLKTSKDPKDYKNSVITFLKVGEKRYKRYIRTKKILYKSE